MRTTLVGCALLAVGMLAGCGSEEEVGPPSAAVGPKLRPAAHPAARETLPAAEQRVAEIVASNDCERIYTLSPLSEQAYGNVPARCEAIRALTGFEAVGSAAYDGGAVIDYEGEEGRTLSVPFFLDADGLYHLAFIDARNEPSVGTPFAPQFDRAAKAAVSALRDKDCSAFKGVVSRSYGPQGNVGDLCGYVGQGPLANLLGSHPRAQPKRLGGNSNFAFYSLEGPEATYTLIMAREPGTVPEGSAEYGYVSAHLTGTATIGLPSHRESIATAVDRVAEAASSSNCDDVYTLNPLSRRPGYDVPAQCATLQSLAALDVVKTAAYEGGAVIDYSSDDGRATSAVFSLDADGLYHLVLVDPYRTQPSVGTPFASQFDAAAEAAVDALRTKDCDAFRRVAAQRYGPGAPPADVCAYVAQNPLATLLDAHPEARPRRLGGNSSYAFYSLAGPDAHNTIVMARESPADLPAGVPPLPAGAPEYGYLDAFLTNTGVRPDPP